MNILDEIATEIANNRLIPFAGAGVSYSQLHVNWNDICAKMNDITGYKGSDNLEAAQLLVDKIGKKDFCDFLKGYFYKREFDDIHGENHLFLMGLNYSKYYTTNQDNLFELCFEKYKRELQIIANIDDFEKYNPKYQALIKFHGNLDNPETVVFCQKDYDNRMPNKEISDLNPLDTQLLADTIAKGIIFIGYSFKDPNIKLIFEHIGKITKNHKHNFYLIEYDPDPAFEDYLKDFNIIAVNPLTLYPDMDQNAAYSKVLQEILTLAYKKQIAFFNQNLFNDTTIIPIRTNFEINCFKEYITDASIGIEKKIDQFRQIFDSAIIPNDCGPVYYEIIKNLIACSSRENIILIERGLRNAKVFNLDSLIKCYTEYFKQLNKIQLTENDVQEKISLISVHIRGYDKINHFEFLPIANALNEIIEAKESPDCLLSYLEILHLSKDFIDEINDEDLRSFINDSLSKAYNYSSKFSNPLNQRGWLKMKSFNDILSELTSSLPKPADFR